MGLGISARVGDSIKSKNDYNFEMANHKIKLFAIVTSYMTISYLRPW
jgi:hypothetical protein